MVRTAGVGPHGPRASVRRLGRLFSVVDRGPAACRRAAPADPHHREVTRWAGEKIIAFANVAGMVAAPGMFWWRQSMLLGDGARPP